MNTIIRALLLVVVTAACGKESTVTEEELKAFLAEAITSHRLSDRDASKVIAEYAWIEVQDADLARVYLHSLVAIYDLSGDSVEIRQARDRFITKYCKHLDGAPYYLTSK